MIDRVRIVEACPKHGVVFEQVLKRPKMLGMSTRRCPRRWCRQWTSVKMEIDLGAAG